MSIKHVLKRILLMLAGYLVAVLVGLIAIAAIYAVLSELPNAPSYFAWLGVSPLAVVLVPPLALFAYVVAIGISCLQALFFGLIAEIFLLRQIWLHALFGAVTAPSGYALLSPTTDDIGFAAGWPDYAILAAAGIVAGLVYWLIAGRDAGFRRAVQAIA